jgi:hypothetical protein
MGTLDTQRWLREPDATSHNGLLTKLHGSVEWSRDEQAGADGTIYLSDPLFKGSDDRHVILYPGFKGLPDREPFGTFHSYFEKILRTASRMIFIGFAFRDDHINRLLRRLNRPECQIVVLNPDEGLSIPLPSDCYRHISHPFDATGIEETLNYLRNARPVGGSVGV